MVGSHCAAYVLLALALTAIASLAVITIFIFKEGLPIIAKAGLGDFLLTSNWRPQQGQFGILFMIIGSVWVTSARWHWAGPSAWDARLF